MDVILMERITRLGAIGDVVKVKNGYARNFLIPMKKALRASDDNKKVFEERRAEIEAKNASLRGEAEKRAEKLNALKLTLVRQASQEGKLYGSVTVRDVAEVLKESGNEVPNSQIVLSGTVKTIGEYPVRLALHAEVNATITINVIRNESEAA
jgi:large subunit ribosomal protein L9